MEADIAPVGLRNAGPRVSVLIPTYNRADLLGAAVASVVAQTYRDFEIVVVDDGSTDDTASVVAALGDRVRYVAVPHRGPVHARNVGFEHARGEYVCLLDSDDLYYPHKLALQVDFLDRHPAAVMIYTEFSGFDDAGFAEEYHLKSYHRSAYHKRRCRYERIFRECAPLADNRVLATAALAQGRAHWLDRYEYVGEIFDRYLHDTIVFTNSMMFRRSALAVVGLQDPYFGHFHDREFALRVCKLGPIGFIDNPTYKLRYHTGQVSATNRPDGDATYIKLQRDLLRVARTHALHEPSYYERNKTAAEALVSRLAEAAAVPLIAYGGGSSRRRRAFSRRARCYLRFAASRGRWCVSLWVVSHAPVPLRRLFFAASRRARLVREALVSLVMRDDP